MADSNNPTIILGLKQYLEMDFSWFIFSNWDADFLPSITLSNNYYSKY